MWEAFARIVASEMGAWPAGTSAAFRVLSSSRSAAASPSRVSASEASASVTSTCFSAMTSAGSAATVSAVSARTSRSVSSRDLAFGGLIRHALLPAELGGRPVPVLGGGELRQRRLSLRL